MTTRIIICRHGNTFDRGDVITRVGARTDMPLSKSGQTQADRLHSLFHPDNSPYRFDRAFCSDLRRTRETALKILKNTHPAKLSERGFLKEIDYGIDEDRPEDEVLKRLGQQAILDWDTKAIVPTGWQVDPHKIRKNWRQFFNEMSETAGDVLVVTSNGIARFCLDVVDHIACETPPLKLATAAFGVVTCTSGKVGLEGWNLKTLIETRR
jgi:probable phosphoglycerate mutase